MKFKIAAGAEIDLLTKAEMAEVITGWMEEVARGPKFRHFSGITTGAGGGAAWTIDGSQVPNIDMLGPRPGFVWSVTGLWVSGAGVTAGTDQFSVFTNVANPSRLEASGLTRGEHFDVGQLVLNSSDYLVLSGVSTGTANGQITVSGRAVELPVQLAWQLL